MPARKATTNGGGRRVIARNRRASHDYHLLEKLEAGLALTGTEVKSLREGRGSLAGAFVRIDDGEAWLVGCQIPEYSHGNLMNHDPMRRRKLLLHRREVQRWYEQVRRGGFTIVPLELYFRGPWAKVEVALAQGKRHADKRQAIAKREASREMARAQRRRR